VSKCKLDTPAVPILRSIVALLVFNAAQEHRARGVVALGNISFQFNMEWFACFKAVQGEAFLRKGANIETSELETKIQHGFAILIRHKTHFVPKL
jgi:hypothetical protein